MRAGPHTIFGKERLIGSLQPYLVGMILGTHDQNGSMGNSAFCVLDT